MVAPFKQATTPYHVSELSDVFCITAKLAADVRVGSKPEVNWPTSTSGLPVKADIRRADGMSEKCQTLAGCLL
jgi:hypothetical protein